MAQHSDKRPASERHVRRGHPSIEELAREQGVQPVMDAHELLGDFWPEDEAIEDFLAAVREWRGHTRDDRAA